MSRFPRGILRACARRPGTRTFLVYHPETASASRFGGTRSRKVISTPDDDFSLPGDLLPLPGRYGLPYRRQPSVAVRLVPFDDREKFRL